MMHSQLEQRLIERTVADAQRAIAPTERKPNRTRLRPNGRNSADEIRVSKRAARYARPYVFPDT